MAQMRLPFTADELRAILDPGGSHPAPWWPTSAEPGRKEVRSAWGRRMHLVERAARSGLSAPYERMLPPRPMGPVVTAEPRPAAFRDRFRVQLMMLRKAPQTSRARWAAMRRMATWE